MADPFLIAGPAVVSFSGGRTSGYMLRRVLDAHGSTLPADVKVVFCNTGKERPETLDFVERCACQWGVPVTWLEYRYERVGYRESPLRVDGHAYVIVHHASASRNGEPFQAVIDAFADFREANGNDAVLPNVVQRFCTVEMKIRTLARYVATLGWEGGWGNAVGLRADEPVRVAKARASRNAWEVLLPLSAAGVTERQVMEFWSRHPFDLALKQHEGNCDLCFLKSRGKVERIMRGRPDLAAWWIAAEEKTGQRFRKDRPSYAALLELSRRTQLPGMEDDGADELSTACHCTD
jgi:3'-phosphoadenosine 5'-phosphosulfate sulfotransferase (PAPS reductase)/FAD synthetase